MKLEELMTSEVTQQEPTYSGGLDFDVISAVEEEKKSAKEAAKERLTKHLKNRSNLRKAIRSGEQTSGNKKADDKMVNTSTLADTFTDVMVSMGKDPAYMQERYGNNQGNLELINKMKGLQSGKYSGDIQNYIDGKNTDLTGLINNMFPEYIAAKTGKSNEAPKVDTLSSDNRSAWEKLAEGASQFKWSDIGLESENRPLKGVIEFGAGIYDDMRKVVPGIKSIANSIAMDKPEEFNKKIEEGKYEDDYFYDKNNGYAGTYRQWKEEMKKKYNDKYMNDTNLTKQIDENKGDMWFNLVDEDSMAYKGGKLTSEIGQQILLDKWLTSAISKGAKLYKGYKTAKNAKKAAQGTELAVKGTELAVPEATVAAESTATKQEAKNIGQRLINWFNKPIPKAGIEGGKAGLEYQILGDVKDGQLSDAQAYGMSAGLGAILGTTLGLLGAGGKSITQPQEQLRTSLKRMGVKDIDEILNRAEAGAKDGTLPSALQRTTDAAVKEAKENVKKKLSTAGQSLGDFRKNIGWSNLGVNDFNDTINKSLTNKGIGAQIVEKDGKYVVEGYPGEYGDILNKIADRINSLKVNLKNKAKLLAEGENVEITSNTSQFEDLISDLKSFSMREPNSEVRQRFIEIEKDLLEDLKGNMTDAQWKEYQDLLKKYSDNKAKYNKVEELERRMNSKNVTDQPKMEDGQYLSDFLDELFANEDISQGMKDRRVAAIFADALYGSPVRQSDKVMYPSKAGGIEEIMRALTRFFRNPRSSLTGGWKSYAKDYTQSKTKKVTNAVLKKAKTAAIGKSAQVPKQD